MATIPNVSERRFVYYTADSELRKISGTEIESLSEFFDSHTLDKVWVSLARYTEPHLSNASQIGATFAVQFPKSTYNKTQVNQYREYFQTDFGVSLTGLETENTYIVVDLTESFDSLPTHQKETLAQFMDLEQVTLNDITGEAKSYNQIRNQNSDNSSFGVGVSARITEHIQEQMYSLVNSENPVDAVESFLTGRNTRDRAEIIVDTLTTAESRIAFETGTVQPSTKFNQLVNKLFDQAVEELSIPVSADQVFTSVDFIPLFENPDVTEF